MEIFQSYKLMKADDGYDLILFMDTPMNDTEFAREFDRIDDDNKQRLNSNIQDYIRDKFPGVTINRVRIMAGTILLASFMMASPAMVTQASAQTGPAVSSPTYDYSAQISLNGQLQSFAHAPFFYNNTTYVSLNEFGSKIGAAVWWNDASNTVGINKNSQQTAFVRGSTVARVNGQQVSMPPSLQVDGVTYVPLRFIAENLGYGVSLDASTNTVLVSAKTPLANTVHTVAAGETLWSLAKRYNTSVSTLKIFNGLTTDTIRVGQQLVLPVSYTVKPGDTLWAIAQRSGSSVAALKSVNNLSGDTLYIGQTLVIPSAPVNQPVPGTPPASQPPAPAAPKPVTSWPEVTYIVQPGDTVTAISKKFGVSISDILRYNYMTADQWLDAGDRIAISGFAPRSYTVTPGEDIAPQRQGALVDWTTEGQYLIKRHATFTVVDVDTGKSFKAVMTGGYNHADIEPVTSADTQVMQQLFPSWNWSPRAVVIYIDGMNIAASLSGMPHGADTTDNGVNGHFDLYLLNSTSHSSSTSKVYMQEHQNMVLKAAGR